jgi:hypothetical protein
MCEVSEGGDEVVLLTVDPNPTCILPKFPSYGQFEASEASSSSAINTHFLKHTTPKLCSDESWQKLVSSIALRSRLVPQFPGFDSILYNPRHPRT